MNFLLGWRWGANGDLWAVRNLFSHRPSLAPLLTLHMASRLLRRYARLLCRTSSQAAPAAARVSLTAAGPAELQRAQGWPWLTNRLMSEGKTVTKENMYSTVPVLTQLDELVEKAAAPEDLLLAWAEHKGNGNQAATALMKWALLVLRTKGKFKEQPPEVMMDARLQDLMDTVSKQVRYLALDIM